MFTDYGKPSINFQNSGGKKWFDSFAFVFIAFVDKQIFKGPNFDISDVLLPTATYIYVTLNFLHRIFKLNLYKIRIVAFALHFFRRL